MNDLKRPPRLSFVLSALIAAATLLAACGAAESAPTPAATTSVQAPPPATQSGDVVAIVNGEELTLEDLQELIGDQLGQMDFEYQSRRHQLIENAARRVMRDQVLEAEAAERGITVDELLEEVLADQVAVSDEDVRLFYLQNQAQLQGRPFEVMAGQIRQYLENQSRDRVIAEFTEGVEDDHGAALLLEPFRVDIDTTGAPVFGPEDAPITMVEFSDFECPYCESFVPTLEQVKADYPDDVKIVFMHFPLRQIHPDAQKAAEASMCAFDQGKFWEAHDLYFAEQSTLGVDDLKEKAGRLGLDAATFAECVDSGRYVDYVQADVSTGIALGVNGTPAVFINGRPLPGGAVPFEMVAEMIDDELERLGR